MKQITVAVLGEANEMEIENTIDIANKTQNSYHFVWDPNTISINKAKYKLKNGAYDLDRAMDDLAEKNSMQDRMFITSLPYSDKSLVKEFQGKSLSDELSQCYFHELFEYPSGNSALISTYIWEHLPPDDSLGIPVSPSGRRVLQPFLLCEFAAVIVDPKTDFPFHEETRGCPFDYCNNVLDIDETFRVKRLCPEHDDLLREMVAKGELTREQRDAAISLFSRAFGKDTKIKYDVFISHATEDKNDFVRPLANALAAKGLRVWYDEFEMRIGDHLSSKIDSGLAQSRFGLVVFSHSFFAKKWPKYELEGLLTKEDLGEKVILPIWHKITVREVREYSLSLAARIALSTSDHTIDELAQKIADVVKNPG